MDAPPSIDDYLEKNTDRFEKELCELLRIPSVSADSAHKDDVRRPPSGWPNQFRRLKLTVELIDTPAIRSCMPSRPPVAGARPCWSTATTTCSLPIRWPSG